MFVYVAHDFWQTTIISSFVFKNVTTYSREDEVIKQGWLPIPWALFITLVGSEVFVVLNFLLFEKCLKSKKKRQLAD